MTEGQMNVDDDEDVADLLMAGQGGQFDINDLHDSDEEGALLGEEYGEEEYDDSDEDGEVNQYLTESSMPTTCLSFKGIYYNDDPNRKFTCPETGAHFEYNDLCKRLNKAGEKRKIIDKQLGI